MSKRNLKWDGQLYLRTFIFLGHTTVGRLKTSINQNLEVETGEL